MTQSSSVPRLLPGIAQLAQRYDGFIIDVWGVLHNGVEPYPGVVAALRRLNDMGKRMTLLSNAPMRSETVMERIAHIGIAPFLYQKVLTSGEEVWQALHQRPDSFYRALGRRCLWLGPDRHEGMVQGLDLELIEAPERGAFILNTGPDHLDDTCSAYTDLMARAIELGMPMVCANPDLEVMQGRELIYCAGHLAHAYEQRGGTVRWHGKPYPSVYATCLEMLGGLAPGQVLAIGDSLRTDIAGASGVGIDSALVASGIHGTELAGLWQETADPTAFPGIIAGLAGTGAQPNWVIPGLLWGPE
ncbi:MAG TPA: TIGR01459 family HAD-type hydrolase [Stellaceae bacterium]|nr:TIGR01459 family HAD-type hydrolase [Stellaceae bacterium]